MAITTGTTERSNSIQAVLSAQLQYEAARKEVWGQFPFIPDDGVRPTGGQLAGQTITLRYQQRMALQTNTVPEKSDITPVSYSDNAVSLSINEYANAVQNTNFARIVTKGDLDGTAADLIAENRTASIDRLVMRTYIGAGVHLRANNVARTGLDSTNDTLLASSVGIGFLGQIQGMLQSAKAPGFDSDANNVSRYATVVHNLVAQDARQAAGYLPALQMREGSDTLFNGELGDINGLVFHISEQGKVYPGAGQTAQAATTLNGAVVAGATSIVVTDATGLSVGDFISLGTVETDNTDPTTVEMVYISAVNGTTLTVYGAGYASGDTSTPGLRYAHASGAAVTEAATVGAIPIFGPRSCMMAYAEDTGRFGKAVVSGPFDILGRFKNFGWYFIGGWKLTNGLWTIVGEVATAYNAVLVNE